VARIRATDQQRREIRKGLFRQSNVQRIARNRLGIAPAVGNRVPRRHRLHRFTPALIAFAPLYATYSYIVVDDTICIVDPDSYAIVDVIEEDSIESAGPPGRPRRPFCSPRSRCAWSMPASPRIVRERSCASVSASAPKFRAASRCLPSLMP
jgi:hypothetical protein